MWLVLIEDSGQPETSADKPQEHPSSEGECDVGETSYKHLPYVKSYGVTLHASTKRREHLMLQQTVWELREGKMKSAF